MQNARRQIGQLITTLLSHYWTGDEDAALRELQIGDWLDDLGRFPVRVVSDACAEWRRTQTKRPTIANIFGLCREVVPREKPIALEGATSSHSSPDELRHASDQRRLQWIEAEQAREKWARECGCTNFAEAMRIGLVAVGKRHPKYLERIAREGKTNVLGTSAAMGSTESGSTAVTVERSKDDIVQDSDNHGDQSQFSDRQSPTDELGPPAFPD